MRKEMLVKRVSEDHKVSKALPVWKDLKGLKALKDLVEKLDLQVQPERKENSEFLVSLVILDHLEKRETKALLADQVHLATKATG